MKNKLHVDVEINPTEDHPEEDPAEIAGCLKETLQYCLPDAINNAFADYQWEVGEVHECRFDAFGDTYKVDLGGLTEEEEEEFTEEIQA